jgi:hypothetical protein
MTMPPLPTRYRGREAISAFLKAEVMLMAHHQVWRCSSQRSSPNAGCPFARVGTTRQRSSLVGGRRWPA